MIVMRDRDEIDTGAGSMTVGITLALPPVPATTILIMARYKFDNGL